MQFWRLTGVYLMGMVLCTVLLVGLSYVSEVYFQKKVPTGVSAVGLIIPAMFAGMSFVKQTGDRPLPREAWGLSLWFTLLQSFIAVAILWTMGFFSAPETLEMAKYEHFTAVAGGFLAFMFILFVLASRGGLSIGVKSAIKQMKRAERG